MPHSDLVFSSTTKLGSFNATLQIMWKNQNKLKKNIKKKKEKEDTKSKEYITTTKCKWTGLNIIIKDKLFTSSLNLLLHIH